ncbi:MAG: hypothetical protein VX527_05350 [Planctomycetota bacterium]|nr:hypothetical protein [Planctomycetota bacterium]
MRLLLTCLASISLTAGAVLAVPLTDSTTIEIDATWWQEPGGWTYPMHVRVPDGPPPAGGFPICILLHGNGGNGQGMLSGFGQVLDCHALVAPTGYANSWNICAEQSDAPDSAMVSELIETLQEFDNVNPQAIRLLGFSNGSALANSVLIEDTNAGLEAVCAVVSQLSNGQYHQGNYHCPANGSTDPNAPFCGYDTPTAMTFGRRYLSICNENDPVIPYQGGESGVGVTFLNAQFATYLIAQSQGYDGPPISGSGEQVGDSDVYAYSYLNGDVTHLRGNAGHGINQTQQEFMVDFLRNCDVIIECEGDYTGDENVNVDDLLSVISGWGNPYGVNDLLAVIAGWGPCP